MNLEVTMVRERHRQEESGPSVSERQNEEFENQLQLTNKEQARDKLMEQIKDDESGLVDFEATNSYQFAQDLSRQFNDSIGRN